MSLICTRCDGTDFLNIHQIPEHELKVLKELKDFHEEVIKWIYNKKDIDVSVCDCCGDGDEGWYGEPGEHYNQNDPSGNNGPYTYNGGLCECH